MQGVINLLEFIFVLIVGLNYLSTTPRKRLPFTFRFRFFEGILIFRSTEYVKGDLIN